MYKRLNQMYWRLGNHSGCTCGDLWERQQYWWLWRLASTMFSSVSTWPNRSVSCVSLQTTKWLKINSSASGHWFWKTKEKTFIIHQNVFSTFISLEMPDKLYMKIYLNAPVSPQNNSVAIFFMSNNQFRECILAWTMNLAMVKLYLKTKLFCHFN